MLLSFYQWLYINLLLKNSKVNISDLFFCPNKILKVCMNNRLHNSNLVL